jgi:hypothetical protein
MSLDVREEYKELPKNLKDSSINKDCREKTILDSEKNGINAPILSEQILLGCDGKISKSSLKKQKETGQVQNYILV